DPATKLLTRAQRPGLADRREHRTHLVVTLDPGDLLDEVLLPGDVDAEAGHLGLELLSAAGDLHGRLLKRVADVAGRDVPAQDEARARRPDAHPPARRRAASFDRAGEDGTARPLDDQARGSVGRPRRRLRVRAALETLRSLRGETDAPRGPQDRVRLEVRALEQ